MGSFTKEAGAVLSVNLRLWCPHEWIKTIIQFAIEKEDKDLILQASKLKRQTLSGYCRLVAVEKALQIIRENKGVIS